MASARSSPIRDKIVNCADQFVLARMSAPSVWLLARLPDLCLADAAAHKALKAGPCRPADIDPSSRKPCAACSSTLSVRVVVRHRPRSENRVSSGLRSKLLRSPRLAFLENVSAEFPRQTRRPEYGPSQPYR